MPFQLDVFCSKIFEICFSSMGCLYKQVHRWNTYSFLGLRPRPMAPALLVVQLLLPSHWEDWWRATILPGANGWEKDCTSWARLLWFCMFPAIRKILGIIRIYFEIYIYIFIECSFNIFQDPYTGTIFQPFWCNHHAAARREASAAASAAAGAASAQHLVELRNRVGGTVEQKDLCLQTLRIRICKDLQGYDGYLYGNSCGNSCKHDGI